MPGNNPGRRSLRKVQLGREVTAGTEVDATDLWRGLGTLLDNRKVDRVNEDIGIIGGTTAVNTPMKGGTINLTQLATFEQLQHVLEASIKTVSGVQDGTGTDYIYTRTLGTTSGNSIKTYTIEGGDDAGEEQMLYSFVKDWTLDGNGRNAWQLSSNWQGRDVAPGTFTANVAVPAVNYMNFGMTSVYLDSIGGTIGSTIKSNTVRKVTLKVESGLQPKDTADGRLDFSFVQGTDYKITAQVEFEHDSIAVAQKVLWRALTPQLMRIKVIGSAAFQTPGTTYTYPTFIANLPIVWSNFEKIADANGNDIVQASLFSAYDKTAAVGPSFVNVVESATIP